MNTVSGPSIADWTRRARLRLQHDATDVMRSALDGRSDLGRSALRFLLTAIEESAAGASLVDQKHRAAWLELRNKVEAFHAFEHVDALLQARVDRQPIVDLTSRAARLAAPLSVWAAEGVGYHATTARCRGSAPPHDLLTDRDPASTGWALIPLHAGMGAALAAHVFDTVGACAGDARLEETIARFERLCIANADPAHWEVAIEALGFVVRGMFGEWLAAVDACVRSTRPALAPLFWHGVGRAIYFAPTLALPLADTRRRALAEAIDTNRAPIARVNTIAGFAWAATLVNLRDPLVIESFAIEASCLGVEAAFARGIHDALDAWRRCAPDDEALIAFRAHVPPEPQARAAWDRLMRAAPTRTVGRAGELFHVPAGEVMHA